MRTIAARAAGCAGGLCALLLLACAPTGESPEEVARERDGLRGEVATLKADREADARYIAETTRALDDVQDSIAKVGKDLGVIHVSLGPGWPERVSDTTQRQSVLTEIQSIDSTVHDNVEKLAALERKYRGSKEQIALLQSIVKGLQQTVAQQQSDLKAMQDEVQRLNGEIAAKDDIIQQRDSTIEDQVATINQQQDRLEQAQKDAHRAYLRIGTIDELERAGVIEGRRSGFFAPRWAWSVKANPGSRLDRFEPIDTEALRDIEVAAAPGVFSVLNAPGDSYEVEPSGRTSSVLHVLDPAAFWVNHFVVIVVKHSSRRPGKG